MHLKVTGHHVDITPALRDYLKNKLDRLERHFDQVTDAHCILTVEKLQHKAEARVNVSGGTLFADAIESDMYAAIDGLIDKLDRQIKKYKEKLNDHHARDAGKRDFS
jgi:putative sigma-54 modulation protein